MTVEVESRELSANGAFCSAGTLKPALWADTSLDHFLRLEGQKKVGQNKVARTRF